MKEKPKYPKMDPGLKKRWVAALRSGKYRQTRRGQLKHKGAYCCLGVLCGPVLGKTIDEFDDVRCPDVGVRLFDYYTEDKLIDLNDQAYYSFKKIADWVEENL